MNAGAPRQEVGRTGEEAALSVYARRGYEPVARNWRCRLGELDLVLVRDGLLVFSEVKARRGSALGAPFEAVDARKRRKLRMLAQTFVAAHPGLAWQRTRFDVASVTIDPGRPPSVLLFEDAF